MKTETRGRPRQFENPVTLPLKVERGDKQYWRQCATNSGQSLNQWMIQAAKKQEPAPKSTPQPKTNP